MGNPPKIKRDGFNWSLQHVPLNNLKRRIVMQSSDRMDDRRKTVIWREWKRGSPMSLIARVLEKPPATVFS
ncbi:hypothetical protein, partial [Noviherbaspirillum sp. Root189]|uniref:hypothetical protein n=1 Tax=Noviherbaspirillum sp. Root189 TaxID=1736487 RepID=UPI001F457E39